MADVKVQVRLGAHQDPAADDGALALVRTGSGRAG